MNDAERLLAKRRENQDYFSGKVSDLTRNIGYGLAAISFAMLSSGSNFSEEVVRTSRWLVILVASAGSITALLDYLQMLSGWFSAKLSAENADGGYEKTPAAISWTNVQHFCFYGKQATAVVGALLLVWIVAGRFGQ